MQNIFDDKYLILYLLSLDVEYTCCKSYTSLHTTYFQMITYYILKDVECIYALQIPYLFTHNLFLDDFQMENLLIDVECIHV